jgi:hypothetical protein
MTGLARVLFQIIFIFFLAASQQLERGAVGSVTLPSGLIIV